MVEIFPPVVVVAYNRPRSLNRILTSLNKAYYPNRDIELIISIDQAEGNQEVLEIANNYRWEYGTKTVNYQETNLGLKKHILKCGALSKEFGSVIVLEDDLFVSPGFFFYACKALTFSLDKTYIGGISLYNHLLNVHTRNHFTSYEDGYDNWYFQFASSWGQAWTKEHWVGFEQWLDNNQKLRPSNKIPNNVINWSDKSWLKYYIVYLIETNKYFLYPKTSFSTNFSDVGTHIGKDSTVYQVPLFFDKKEKFSFSSLNDSSSVYDAFFENIKISKFLEKSYPSLCVDLYGSKMKNEKRFLLTTKVLDFKILKTYGMSLKPIDANIFEVIDGSDIFLYDTGVVKKNKIEKGFYRRFNYEVKHITFQSAGRVFLQKALAKVKNIINRIIKTNQ